MADTGVSEGNIVKEFHIGNTRIKICDDHCRDKSSEDTKAILHRIALKTQAQLTLQQPLSKSHIE